MPVARRFRRMIDFGAYIVIAGTLLVVVVFYAPSDDFVTRWVGLAVNTAILFGYAIRRHWQYSRSLQFWLVLSALLLVHLGVYITTLRSVDNWKAIWFFFLYMPEEITIDTVVGFVRHRLQW